ncbi:MAG: hypothetical protein GX107_03620 [Clostridiales bacterium]|jgi:hypothetical protein|nr:hypothetical protein [Clostridiales bacterium]
MEIKDFADKYKKELSKKGLTALSKCLRGAFSATGKVMSGIKPPPEILQSKFDYIANPKSESFTAGFGKAGILPDGIPGKKYYIAGYGENNPAQGVIDVPYAHALWLDDNSGRGAVLLISLDIVGMLNSDVNALRASLADFARATDCRHISIMATHNHAGIDTMGIWGRLPFSGKSSEYMSFLFDRVKTAAIEAYKDRRDGDLMLGSIEVPDMQEDIRLPIVYSKTLTRVRFVPNDGSRDIYIVNFASHSESLQGCNSRVSADFPGYMRDEIREKTGAETIYFVGAIGGMISMLIENEREIRDSGGDFAESTKNIGKKLAGYALSIKDEKKLAPTINFIRREFFIEADNSILMLAKTAGIIKAKAYFDGASSLGLSMKTEMTYFEIGDLHMLLLPCEIFPELAYGGYLSADESATGLGPEVNPKPLVEIADDEGLVIFGVANDEIGYVLPKNDFLLHPDTPYLEKIRDRHGRNHYEETNSAGPNTAQTIADTFESIIKTVRETKSFTN